MGLKQAEPKRQEWFVVFMDQLIGPFSRAGIED